MTLGHSELNEPQLGFTEIYLSNNQNENAGFFNREKQIAPFHCVILKRKSLLWVI